MLESVIMTLIVFVMSPSQQLVVGVWAGERWFDLHLVPTLCRI
jgi:hypothetical protein